MKGVARKLVLVASLALALASPAARAMTDDPTLAPDEHVRLMHGETITRPETITREGRRYVGGLTYTVVNASEAELDAMLDDPATYTQILPRTKEARVLGREGDDVIVELRQGTALLEASYAIVVRRTGREVRFWVDPRRPHDIEDAWGFFRIEPLAQVAAGTPRSLLTYGVLVDLGPGLVRDLFEERIRSLTLTVPDRVKGYVARAFRRPAPRA